MKTQLLKQSLVGFALLVAVLAPFVISTFAMTIAITALVFAIFAISLNLILGYAGLPSLGHAAFFGTGAYAVGLLTQHGIYNFIPAVLIAIASSALFGLILGPILLRTRTTYFLMATLAIGEVMQNLSISWRAVTNGDDGLSGIKLPVITGLNLADRQNFYFFLLAALVIVLAFTAMLMRAPFGHTLCAIRDNRIRMSVLGVRPLTIEIIIFVISAGIAGFAGAMFAYANGFVSPDVLSVETSADVLLMVVLGGPATLFGPIVGTVIIEAIRGIGSIYTHRWLTFMGLLAVIVALDPKLLFSKALAQALGRLPPAEAESVSKKIAPRAEASDRQSRPSFARGPAVRSVISADGIEKRFGGLSVLSGVAINVAAGERRGLIGPNGAGKTTFLNILSGIASPNGGHVRFDGHDITWLPPFQRAKLGIGRTFQTANLFNDCTVRENIVLSLLAREGYSFRFVRALSRYSAVQNEATKLLDKWGLRDWESMPVKLLAYGQRRLVEIILAVAQRPKLLLLDEPAAGLSNDEAKLIIQTISTLDPQLSLLIVEHNMDLVFSICDSITVIADGRVLAEGTGDQIRRNEAVVEAYLGMPL